MRNMLLVIAIVLALLIDGHLALNWMEAGKQPKAVLAAVLPPPQTKEMKVFKHATLGEAYSAKKLPKNYQQSFYSSSGDNCCKNYYFNSCPVYTGCYPVRCVRSCGSGFFRCR